MISFKPIRRTVFYLFLLVCLSSFSRQEYDEGSVRYFDDVSLGNPIIEESEVQNTEESPATDVQPDHVYDRILDKVIEEGRFVEELDASSFFSLPVGISLFDGAYSLVVYESVIHADYAEFNAFLIITNPLDGNKLRLDAKNVRYSFSGGISSFRLELMESEKTALFSGASLEWKSGTYAQWDCNGLDHVLVNADLTLSDKKFVKVNPLTGEEQGKININISTRFKDINDFVVDVSIPAFKVKGFDEAYFQLKNAVLDCSDFRNASSFQLPADYPGGYRGEMKNLWRGIYVNEATVFLSSKFNTESQNNPVSFSASEMIIDDYGFTGVVTARNILNTEEGALGNWPFSINELSLGFFTGSFDSFGFSGDVMLPGSTTLIEYNAFLDYEGVYQFGITTGKDIEFDVFAANVELYETSEINVFIENGKFVPTALLDGNIAFSCAKSNGDEMASVPRLDFQGMRLSAAPQYFDIDYLAVEGIGSGGLAQFPISFNRIELAKQGNLIGFSFDVKVNLAPVDGAGITGEGNFSILADISGEKWRFEKLDLNAFAVDTQKEGAFSIKGELEIFRDDPVYGDAFYGNLKASFANTIQNQDGLELKVAGMFGKADFGRYFFVDAFVALGSASVPVGPFMLNGFGGGLSYGMKRTSAESEVGNRTVASVSGVRYLPDRTAGLGISAAIQAGIVQESLAKGSINFGVTFNRGTGGIKQISFYGEVAMIAPVESLSAVEMKELSGVVANGGDLNLAMSTPMKASISMEMIVEEKTFDAKLQVWLNVAGAIKGVGTNNLAGSAIFHYEPGKWNLLVGTPSQPVGVEFVGLIKTQSYFMAGHDLPAAMMMNEKVLSILGMSQADFNGERGENDLIYGNGLAFGTNFEISTGDISFLIFYASLDLGAGFDVMLMDYGDYAFCEGGPNPVGINGWYASGQAYAYFAGKIGIKVKVFGKRKKFDIINVQTAAALRLEGPNPIWMKGVVGGKYKVLGGLVSGHCRFEVTVGEKCKLKTGPDELSDMTIISGLTPTNGDEEVDIFTLPQAVFNMPVGKELKISEDENLSREFRINLLEYSVYEGDRRLEGAVEWNPEKTTLAFTPGTIFYPETEYRVVAEISFDEKINGNWQQYQDENGELYVENKSVSFETGLLPDKIPVDYVDATYPVNRMMNFYKNENSNAYLIFNSDIAPFFQQIEGWEQKARWVPIQGGSPVKADFSYHPGSRELVSPVPSNILNETMYRFELVNIPLSDKNAIDRNVTEKTDRVLAESDSSFTDIRTRNAKGVISEQEEKVFYSLSFRTSKYNKFLDKLPGTEMNVRFLFNSSPGIDYPGATVYDSELFDGYELYGSSDFNSLIRCSAQLSGADWYQEHIYPLLYEDYPWAGDVVVNRDVSEYGMPPQHPVMIWQIDYDYILTDNDLATGTIGHRAEFAHFIYGVSKIWANDFSAIRNNIFASEINASNRTDQMEEVSRRHIWPQVDEGTYPIKVEYVLPGKNTVTSSQIVNLNNPYDVPQVETLTDDDQQIEP